MAWYEDDYPQRRTVADLRDMASEAAKKLVKRGEALSPVRVEGRKIVQTFWGKAWCKNLESYADMAHRLSRGRSYVCNGCVIDLQITPGEIHARVHGSELYKVAIKIKPIDPAAWAAIKQKSSGQIGSLVELLQGKLSQAVMEVVTAPGTGLFPKPAEIKMDCSCPDYADVCKHVAATLYGIGARLDAQPELLFKLRGVDHLELIDAAGEAAVPTAKAGKSKRLATSDLGDVFGIELEAPAVEATKVAKKKSPKKK